KKRHGEKKKLARLSPDYSPLLEKASVDKGESGMLEACLQHAPSPSPIPHPSPDPDPKKEDICAIPYGIAPVSEGEVASQKPELKIVRQEYPPEFEQVWNALPYREGGNSKKAAFKRCKARIREGATWGVLLAGARGYAAYTRDK